MLITIAQSQFKRSGLLQVLLCPCLGFVLISRCVRILLFDDHCVPEKRNANFSLQILFIANRHLSLEFS